MPLVNIHLKNIWEGWKNFARRLGVAQTYFLVTLLYWILVPFFSLIRLKNPLRLKLRDGGSFWLERKHLPNSMDRAKQQS